MCQVTKILPKLNKLSNSNFHLFIQQLPMSKSNESITSILHIGTEKFYHIHYKKVKFNEVPV